MCSSTTAERQSLASRDRTCCLRRCLPARPLRYYGFRGSMAHPTQSLCTLRTRRRRRPRNTRYRAPATAYPHRSLTGRTTPAYLAHKQSIKQQRKYGLLRRFAPRNDGVLISDKHSHPAARCARVMRLSLAPREGVGNAGCPLHPPPSHLPKCPTVSHRECKKPLRHRPYPLVTVLWRPNISHSNPVLELGKIPGIRDARQHWKRQDEH